MATRKRQVRLCVHMSTLCEPPDGTTSKDLNSMHSIHPPVRPLICRSKMQVYACREVKAFCSLRLHCTRRHVGTLVFHFADNRVFVCVRRVSCDISATE